MHPDLQAQLHMMSPELQEYVRKLQITAQMRKDTSQLEDEDVADLRYDEAGLQTITM